MLRSTVSDLHPAVLEHAGLARAVHDLAVAQARRDFTVDVNVDDWPDGVQTPVDALLFSAARELLSNVVKHAGASRASIAVGLYGDSARLVVSAASPTRAARRSQGRRRAPQRRPQSGSQKDSRGPISISSPADQQVRVQGLKRLAHVHDSLTICPIACSGPK